VGNPHIPEYHADHHGVGALSDRCQGNVGGESVTVQGENQQYRSGDGEDFFHVIVPSCFS
jgi:hypothetical protein